MSKRHRMSYARARLWLGIANVGFWVVLAAVALRLDLPGQFFPAQALIGKKLAISLATFLGGYIALQAPFDLLGGYILPKLHRRYYGDFSDFVTNWVRGVTVQAAIFFLIGLTWLWKSEWLIGLAWMSLLLACQPSLARIMGDFQARGENAWKSLDDAFTGGIAGFPGMQKAIFVTGRGQRLRAMDERRRHHVQKLFMPVAGIVIATSFNLLGLLMAVQLVRHPLQSVAGLVELALWFTLWSFVGLLILPSLSRPSVYAGDYALYVKGVEAAEFEHYLQYDFSQAGEEERSKWVEWIFHPVPSVANRLARWGQAPGWSGGWHAARYAIYLSWSGLSLLNRAVHCNVGKPNVWVMLPCD
ncbi:MAG: hypothetical protein ABIT76_05425 [Chthoniobacterales bacterium]